jgi:hypothetical protein
MNPTCKTFLIAVSLRKVMGSKMATNEKAYPQIMLINNSLHAVYDMQNARIS